MYAIVDIETTGSRLDEDRITEVAIFIFDGEQVVDSFHSLINPERSIPAYITQLTGISNEMVENAPKFYEIAKDIVKFTENQIIVAHNAHFDYNFLKSEFKSLGFRFQRKTLCTVRLSRKVFPQFKSHSLKNLCISLDIPLENHHRASADAAATCKLFEIILRHNEAHILDQIITNEISIKALPPKISLETIQDLPEEAGVYYFLNEQNDIIYIGKSKNIRKRIASHFGANLDSRKSIEFKNQIADIDYVLTGNELIALLLESDEIKLHKPLFNRAQRRSRKLYGIFSRINKQGYLCFFVDKLDDQSTKTILFTTDSSYSAKNTLRSKVKKHQLCMKLAGLYETKAACFDYQIKNCAGACIAEEPVDEYNQRALQALESFNVYAGKNFIIPLKGRNMDENAIVCVEKGKYIGFGYLDKDDSIQHLEEAKNYIQSYDNNQDTQKIINAWLKKNHAKVIYI